MIRFEIVDRDTLDRLGEMKARPIEAIPTPFPSWNKLCGEEGGRVGLAKGWVVIVGGIPGAGKSNLGYNLASQAVLAGKRVGVVNFEMSEQQAVTRYVSILTGVPRYKMEQGKTYDPRAWEEAKDRVEEIREESGGYLRINDANVFSLGDIKESYEKLADDGVEMILVDYAQLVQVRGQDGIFQRTEAVANVLRGLTHKHKVVSIVLSQFNRDMSSRPDAPPSRHGLHGGSAWENNANQIMLLNHAVRARSQDLRYEYTELLGDKNRHGMERFTIPLKWDHRTGRADEHIGGSDPEDPWESESVRVSDDVSPPEGPIEGDRKLVGEGPRTIDLFEGL